MNKGMRFAVLVLAMCLTASIGFNAALAQDNASNTPYKDGWDWGDYGGSGFGGWELYPQNSAGFFVASSTTRPWI